MQLQIQVPADPIPTASMVQAPSQEQRFLDVCLPAGVVPGKILTVQDPATGQSHAFTVPPGVVAGQTIKVPMPSAAQQMASAVHSMHVDRRFHEWD